MTDIRPPLGYLTTALEDVVYIFVFAGVNLAAIIIATVLFPVFYTAGIAIKIAQLKGRQNKLAGPGTPEIQWPRLLPLSGKSQTAKGSRTGWFVGILWILQSESFLEVAMVFQILPILLVPLQVIFNNVLEEVLSWFYGKYDFDKGQNEPTISSLRLLFGVLPWRIWRSYGLLKKWLSYMVFGSLEERVPADEGYRQWSLRLVKKGLSRLIFGKVETEYLLNKNHAFINYIQGIDFSIDEQTLEVFPTKEATSKENALVLAKASHIAYERIYIIRDIVTKTWSGVQFKGGWEFDYVRVQPPGSKEYKQVNSDISAVLLQVGKAGSARALILAFRGTEPLRNVNWAVDFETEPPPPGNWKYGVYHMGFRTALGLGPNLASDDASSCVKYLSCNAATGKYERREEKTSPYRVMREAIDALLKDDMKLYVTGHSLGAALASIFTAALVVPPQNETRFDAKKHYGALCTLGQPRVGDARYTINLENALSRNRMDRRYMRIVNTDDIVCRMPPPQVTPPPWHADAPFWQHPGHLVFLPAVPARFKEVQVTPAQNGVGALPQKTPTKEEAAAPEYQLGARERNPSAVQLLEQPTIFRGSSLWHAIKKAIWGTQDLISGGAGINRPSTLTWSPPPSVLRVLTLWLLIVTVVPLGVVLLPTPLFPVGVALIAFGLLEGGLPQGVSDHALDGYIRAIVASSTDNWTV